MRISKRCEYGLRAMIDLGIAWEMGRPLVQIGELARQERIPAKFLEQILLQLKAAGFVQSRRGKTGGYSVRQPPGAINMGDLVRLFEVSLAPIPCVSRTAYARCSCPDEDHCGLRMLMSDVRNAMASVLDRHTLGDIVELTLRRFRRDHVPPPFFVPR